MKQIIIGLLLLGTMWQLSAQSTPQYTQFFFNKLFFNPGYAGSKDVLAVNAHYRHQWEGVDGAPRTGTVTAHMPFFHNRCGIGLSVTNDRIALLESNSLRLSYAYRIPIKANRSTLSIGLQGVFQQDRFNWNRAQVLEVQDGVIPFGQQQGGKGDFGLGLYYASDRYYLGVSMPQFFDDGGLKALFQFEDINQARTYYAMSGLAIPLSDKFVLKPAILAAFNPNAPLSIDLNLSVLMLNTIWIGATLRTGAGHDSVDAVFQYQLNKQWRAGIAYDLTLSELATYSQGSLEFIVEYLFDKDMDRLKNLRFF
ncbi:MAG: type IX secretion system membrane protein PorP/SprF [Saprospiraceae bacterium]